MTTSVPERLRRQVQERAHGRCEYCHFRRNSALIEGMTASGRATVTLLHLNDAERGTYRLGLIEIGHYPSR